MYTYFHKNKDDNFNQTILLPLTTINKLPRCKDHGTNVITCTQNGRTLKKNIEKSQKKYFSLLENFHSVVE